MAAVAARPPLSGYLLDLPIEKVREIHEHQLHSMFQSFQLEAADLDELRATLMAEGYSVQRIDELVEEAVQTIRKFTSDPLPPGKLTQLLADYQSSLQSVVFRAGFRAMGNLKNRFICDESHSAQLSARIWFDATEDIRAQRNAAQEIEKLADLTVAQEAPVFEESLLVQDQDKVQDQIREMEIRVDRAFREIIEHYPLPSRIVIEWKLACPEENHFAVHLDSEIPLIARSSMKSVPEKINPQFVRE